MSANRDFVRHLVRELGLKQKSRVLDLGCGDGWMCRLFTEHGLDVWGVDLLPKSIDAARHVCPSGTFRAVDVFDLKSQADLAGRFDLVFCRDLGVAQKIVDWADPDWIGVGRSVVDLLKPDGVLYWIQMTDRSDRINSMGFSNPSWATLRRYFGGFGHIQKAHVFDFISLYVTPSAGEDARFASIDHREYADPRQRTKALFAQLSQLLLKPPEHRLVTCENRRWGRMARRIALHIGLSVLHVEISSEDLKRHRPPVYLISGDQDAIFESSLLPPLMADYVGR